MLQLLALALWTAAPLGFLQEPKPPEPKPAPLFQFVKPYNINSPIDEIRLTDLDGKEHALFAENEAKAVVLVFWSYRDPVSRFYVKQLSEMHQRYADKLSLVLVDSNHDELVINGDAIAKIREVVKAEGITLPLLLDRENRVADDFDALNNAQAFLIDANRFLRYKGGIDDDPRGERRKRGIEVLLLLEKAIDVTLRAEKLENNWTMASGRPIRRTPKPAATSGAGGR